VTGYAARVNPLRGRGARSCTKVEAPVGQLSNECREGTLRDEPVVELSPYAQPPAVPPPLEECLFYHSIDLPGLGEQLGRWDLRPGIDAYLGPNDFSGLRVLEIGTANGFVCFELERRGAEVVTLDLLVVNGPSGVRPCRRPARRGREVRCGRARQRAPASSTRIAPLGTRAGRLGGERREDEGALLELDELADEELAFLEHRP
jgi:hypothetical protein